MAKSSDRLALTQQLAANADSQAGHDDGQVDGTAQTLEGTAERLRSMATDLGIVGDGADAAWEAFNTLAKDLVVRADQFARAAAAARIAHAAVQDAKLAYETLPEGDIDGWQKAALVGGGSILGPVGTLTGIAAVDFLGDQKAAEREEKARRALNALESSMATAHSDLPVVTYAPEPDDEKGVRRDEYTDLPPSEVPKTTGTPAPSPYPRPGSGGLGTVPVTPVNPGPGGSVSGAPGTVGSGLGGSGLGGSGSSGDGSADGTVTGVVPGSGSGSGGGAGGVGGTGGTGIGTGGGYGGAGGALAGGMAIGGAAFGATGLGRVGAGGMGGAGGGAGGLLGGGAGGGVGLGAGGLNAGARGSGLGGTTGSGLVPGSSTTATGAAAGGRGGAAAGGMPMGGGAGGAGSSKGRRRGAGGYLAPDVDIEDEAGPVNLGSGAHAGSRGDRPAIVDDAFTVEFDDDSW